MQLLFEEFFKKIYNLSKGGSLLLKVSVRLLIYSIVLSLIGLVIYSIIAKEYTILIIILGLLILGESAHYIRKLKEKDADKTIPKDSSKEHTKEILKTTKSKNKNLLKTNKPKNKNLLKK